VFMRLRRNLMYFIFCLTRPPEMQISSQRTTTTFCPLSSSFATMDASRPSMWCRASTTTLFAQIPEPDTIFTSPHYANNGTNLFSHGAGWLRRRTLGFLKLLLGFVFGPSPTHTAYLYIYLFII